MRTYVIFFSKRPPSPLGHPKVINERPLMMQVLTVLHFLSLSTKIILVWIPSHCAIVSHDNADAASKTTAHTFVPVLNSFNLEEHIRYHLENEQNTRWPRTVGKLCHLKSDIQDRTNAIRRVCNTTRILEIAVKRFLLGHTQTTHEHIFLWQPLPVYTDCSIHSQFFVLPTNIPVTANTVIHHYPTVSTSPPKKIYVLARNHYSLIYATVGSIAFRHSESPVQLEKTKKKNKLVNYKICLIPLHSNSFIFQYL